MIVGTRIGVNSHEKNLDSKIRRSEIFSQGPEAGGLAKIPYWRTLKADGFLNEKYPGGLEAHQKRLIKEGHKIITRGKKYQVADFEKRLFKL